MRSHSSDPKRYFQVEALLLAQLRKYPDGSYESSSMLNLVELCLSCFNKEANDTIQKDVINDIHAKLPALAEKRWLSRITQKELHVMIECIANSNLPLRDQWPFFSEERIHSHYGTTQHSLLWKTAKVVAAQSDQRENLPDNLEQIVQVAKLYL